MTGDQVHYALRWMLIKAKIKKFLYCGMTAD